jgi:uncharacterized protein (DUF1330 family)
VSAYLVANYKLTNPDAYQAYVPAVLPTLEAHGAEVLVADYESEAVEGTPHSVTIVLRFPSKDAAQAWYRSPEYQSVINLRTDNTEGFVVFVDHFTTPYAG